MASSTESEDDVYNQDSSDSDDFQDSVEHSKIDENEMSLSMEASRNLLSGSATPEGSTLNSNPSSAALPFKITSSSMNNWLTPSRKVAPGSAVWSKQRKNIKKIETDSSEEEDNYASANDSPMWSLKKKKKEIDTDSGSSEESGEESYKSANEFAKSVRKKYMSTKVTAPTRRSSRKSMTKKTVYRDANSESESDDDLPPIINKKKKKAITFASDSEDSLDRSRPVVSDSDEENTSRALEANLPKNDKSVDKRKNKSNTISSNSEDSEDKSKVVHDSDEENISRYLTSLNLYDGLTKKCFVDLQKIKLGHIDTKAGDLVLLDTVKIKGNTLASESDDSVNQSHCVSDKDENNISRAMKTPVVGNTQICKTALQSNTCSTTPKSLSFNKTASDSPVWGEPRINKKKEVIEEDYEKDCDENKENNTPRRPNVYQLSPEKSKNVDAPINEIEEKLEKLAVGIKDNEYGYGLTERLPDGGARLRQVKDFLVEVTNSPRKNKEEMSKSLAAVVQSELANTRRKLALLRGAGSKLPDGGQQLMLKIGEAEKELSEKEAQVKNNQSGGDIQSPSSLITQAWQAQKMNLQSMISEDRNRMLEELTQKKSYGAKVNESKELQFVRSTIMEALNVTHTNMETMPAEDNMVEQPVGLRSSIQLFPHQKQALSWLLWRESQHPAGGILADGMGFGKTLTMISLILKQRELEEENRGKKKKVSSSKATLVVCPTSLLGQWEREVETRVEKGKLRVCVYHGSNKKWLARNLANYDLVITTYQTVQSEVKAELGEEGDKKAKVNLDNLVAAEDLTSTSWNILSISWGRIILDEAHQIRNPRSLKSQAVCRLRADRRWCISGTPIQNKELNMYPLVRFLRCSPFDEYRVWKVWISDKHVSMSTLVKSLLLRRTMDTTKEDKTRPTRGCVDEVTGRKTRKLGPVECVGDLQNIELTHDDRTVYLSPLRTRPRKEREAVKKASEDSEEDESEESSSSDESDENYNPNDTDEYNSPKPGNSERTLQEARLHFRKTPKPFTPAGGSERTVEEASDSSDGHGSETEKCTHQLCVDLEECVCDVCGKESPSDVKTFYCDECDYTECEDCYNSHRGRDEDSKEDKEEENSAGANEVDGKDAIEVDGKEEETDNDSIEVDDKEEKTEKDAIEVDGKEEETVKDAIEEHDKEEETDMDAIEVDGKKEETDKDTNEVDGKKEETVKDAIKVDGKKEATYKEASEVDEKEEETDKDAIEVDGKKEATYKDAIEVDGKKCVLKLHGRVQVKTSAQQDEEKRLERAAKLKGYRGAMASIFKQRGDTLNDELQLDLTSRVLLSNPDIGTLWNIRREILLRITVKDTTEEDTAPADAQENKDTKDKDKILLKELDLTQQCLMTNPKSYGAWHHREWSLEKMDSPDWPREIGLCNKFLQLDERNFHCWDYRKMAVSKIGLNPEQELSFTMERINVNFSNYSAWHYRSKLLPQVYPDPENVRPIEEKVHNGELDLVQNAAFTDPDDSSAWFYHSWLVGRQRPRLLPALLLLDDDAVVVVTTVSVPAKHLNVKIDGSEVNLNWKSVNKTKFDVMWKAERSEIKAGVKLEFKIHDVEEVLEVVDVGKRVVIKGSGWKNKENRFDPLPSENTRHVLEQELDNCNQLLDLEPSSKWTLYTKAALMSALDSQKHHTEILEILDQLMEIDYLRKGYYQDWRSKFVIEHAIEMNEDKEVLDLSNQNITKMYHPEYLCLFTEVKADWDKIRSKSAKEYLHCDKTK